MRRILYFIITNIAIVATVTILARVLGVEPYLTEKGLNYGSLAIMSLLWGMTGSIISLLISRWMAKRMMGVQVLEPTDPNYGSLVKKVYEIAQKAGMKTMPEVGVYHSPELNAFATGPSQSRSLVAVSTGLLQSMNEREVEGVLAHEVAHITNGDMVTMTLIQGVVNAFVIFISRIVASLMRDRDGRGSSYGIYILCQIVFGFLGSMVTAAFSRAREFRADAGSAQYVGRDKMVEALQALQRHFPSQGAGSDTPKQMQALQISGGGMMKLFSTHPPLEKRIEALQKMQTL